MAAMQSGFSGDGTSSDALYYHWGALHMHLAAIWDAQAKAFSQRKELNIAIIIAICTEPSASSSYHATHDNMLVVTQDANGRLRKTAHWFEPWAQGPRRKEKKKNRNKPKKTQLCVHCHWFASLSGGRTMVELGSFPWAFLQASLCQWKEPDAAVVKVPQYGQGPYNSFRCSFRM